MSREIDCYNLVYKFKGPIKPIIFTKFGSPMYTYDESKKSRKNITTSRKIARRF